MRYPILGEFLFQFKITAIAHFTLADYINFITWMFTFVHDSDSYFIIGEFNNRQFLTKTESVE